MFFLQSYETFINGLDVSVELYRINRYYFNIYFDSFYKIVNTGINKRNAS